MGCSTYQGFHEVTHIDSDPTSTRDEETSLQPASDEALVRQGKTQTLRESYANANPVKLKSLIVIVNPSIDNTELTIGIDQRSRAVL
jgi:hypothetical protein